MDVYHIWFDLKSGIRDTQAVEAATAFLDGLKKDGKVSSWRLLRRKLGLSPLPEFHIMIETNGLAQLDEAFGLVASRGEPVESQHFALNSLAENLSFALERDFPDAVRKTGGEKF